MEIQQRNERLGREEVGYKETKTLGFFPYMLLVSVVYFSFCYFPLLFYYLQFLLVFGLNLPEAEKRMSHEIIQKCLEYCYVPHNVFGPTVFKEILYWNSDTKTIKWKNKRSVYSRYHRAQFRMFKPTGSAVRPVLNCQVEVLHSP